MKGLDVKKFLKRNSIAFKQVNDELLLDCPICGKEEHFYLNNNTGLCVCHKCKYASNHIGYMLALGFSKDDVTSILSEDFRPSINSIGRRIKDLMVVDGVNESLNFLPTYFKNPLPEGCRSITEKNFPRALAERKISCEVVKALGAKICNKKGVYLNRIIFPVATLRTRTFIAQTGWTKKKCKAIQKAYKKRGLKYRKILFPKGSFMNEVLYLYNIFEDEPGDLFVVEGHADVLRMLRFQKNAVGSFGSVISREQMFLLSKTEADRIFWMPDGEVSLDIKKKYGKRLQDMCGDKEVRVCHLPEALDPDDSSDKILTKAINNSQSVSTLGLGGRS